MKSTLKSQETGRRPRDKSLYRSIADTLRREVSEGKWPAGHKEPSLRTLATQFKVSTMTINQALRILHEEGLVTRLPAVGTFTRHDSPDKQANAQASIAFATIEIESSFTSRIATGIEEACRNRGWTLQVYNAEGHPEIEAQSMTRVVNAGAKGAVMLVTGEVGSMEALFRLKLTGFPFVLIDRSIRGLNVDLVESNHEQAAYLGTQYLLAHGFRRINFLSCSPGLLSSADDRWRGYERALQDHGIESQRSWRIICDVHRAGKHRWSNWGEAALAALPTMEPPMAFVTLNVHAARGLLEACDKLKLRVPQDVSLISFDDTEFMQAHDPPITVLAQRTREIGRTAVEQLERRIEMGPEPAPQQILIEMDLIERQSVRRLDEAVLDIRPGSLSQAAL